MPTDIAKCLVKSTTAGRAQVRQFIWNRLNSNEISFWEPLPSLKIQTFDLAVNKVAVKAANEKIFTISGERVLFGRLLLSEKVQNVDIKEVKGYELAYLPISLAHPNGSLSKTSSDFLFFYLRS